jgi:hypothetical protein
MGRTKTFLAASILVATAVIAGVAVRAAEPVPLADPETGVGEELILVVADQLPTISDALRAVRASAASFSDVQGFYVAAADDYEVTGVHVQLGPDTLDLTCPSAARRQIECAPGRDVVHVRRPIELRFVPKTLGMVAFRPGTYLLATAFRTRKGAEEFLDLARTVGLHGLITVSARKLGGGFVGLGQEPHPNGSGPLLGPLEDQTAFQR